jgi:carboxyl-terminal processing protease
MKTKVYKKKTDAMFFNQPRFWNSDVLKTPFAQNISTDEKIAGLSKFWSETKYNFVNFDLIPTLDLDSLYLAYIPKVSRTKSTQEYYRILSEFCAHLKDGHTNVYVPKELEEEEYSRPLLRTRLIEDKVVIVSIHDSSYSKQGIKVGQELVKIDGVPVKEYAAKMITPFASASTVQDLDVRSFDYVLLAGSVKKSIKLVLRDQNGNVANHTIRRVSPLIRNEKMKLPNFELQMLDDKIAYVILNSFGSDEAFKEFEKYYDKIAQSEAIIFDVRGNGGGNSAVGWNILRYTIKQPTAIHRMHGRLYNSAYRAWNMKQSLYTSFSRLSPKGDKLYEKPIVVLTSARTYSAAEDFAGAFKSMQRGEIIGEASGGSSGQPLMIDLPGNGSARICTKRDMLGNGEDFIGVGVQPDIVVAQKLDDLRKGKDTVLDAALKRLRNK